jgi:hypothetical protein
MGSESQKILSQRAPVIARKEDSEDGGMHRTTKLFLPIAEVPS